jgi:hypothetical protein
MLKQLLADYESQHSDFQMDHFITGASGRTPYGRYKQALRELSRRVESLEASYRERETKLRELAKLDEQIMATEKEFKRFYIQGMALKKKVGDLSNGRRDVLEADEWIAQVRVLAAKDLFASGRISGKTLDMIVTMPFEKKQALLKDIKENVPALIDWFVNLETEAYGELEFTDVRKMIGESNGDETMATEGEGRGAGDDGDRGRHAFK